MPLVGYGLGSAHKARVSKKPCVVDKNLYRFSFTIHPRKAIFADLTLIQLLLIGYRIACEDYNYDVRDNLTIAAGTTS